MRASGTLTLPTPAATLYMGVAERTPAFVSDGVVTIRSGGINHLTVRFADATGIIELRRGNHAGTVIATSTYAYPLNVWRHIQVKAIINDAGGECVVQVDGSTVLSYIGDTNNGGTPGALNVEQLTFGIGNNNAYFDDLWVCDEVDATATQGQPNNTFLGDLRVSSLMPNGNGSQSQLTGSDGNSVDNYLLVDETPANTTEYVAASTVGLQDFYTMEDLPANTVGIYGLRVGGYVQKSDAGAAGIKMGIRESGGTVTLDGTYPLSTTWTGTYSDAKYVKPSDSSLWTVSDVNGLEAGAETTS